jgi:Xaa-Pro aminopeptidase
MEKQKVQQAIHILNELDIDLWLVVNRESDIIPDPMLDFVVGTGVTWLSFFLYFRSGEKYAIVGNLDVDKLQRLELFDRVLAYRDSPRDFLKEILVKHNPSKIALDFSLDCPAADGLTHGCYLQIQELLKETDFLRRFITAEQIVAKLRGRKTAEEIVCIKTAVEKTLFIFNKLSKYAKAGMTELQIAGFITAQRKRLRLPSAWEEGSCPAVFTGPQTIGAHSAPTDKKLQPGHVFNVDFGVKYKGYCADLQRTWYVRPGNEKIIPAAVQKGFRTIVESIKLAVAAMKPGIRGLDIDRLAREYIVDRGYEEFPHALGHQVGRSAHDGGGMLAPTWERYGNLPHLPLEIGQVYTVEPRIYIKDHGVATVEEMVFITEKGAEFISMPQTDIYVVG